MFILDVALTTAGAGVQLPGTLLASAVAAAVGLTFISLLISWVFEQSSAHAEGEDPVDELGSLLIARRASYETVSAVSEPGGQRR